jgi:hypothetical protein
VAAVGVTVGEADGGRFALGSGAPDENLPVSPRIAWRSLSPGSGTVEGPYSASDGTAIRQPAGERGCLADEGDEEFHRLFLEAAYAVPGLCYEIVLADDTPWWQWVSGRPWALGSGLGSVSQHGGGERPE